MCTDWLPVTEYSLAGALLLKVEFAPHAGDSDCLLYTSRDALRDQMGWIRNRTTLMGVNPAYVNDCLLYTSELP